MALTNRVFHDAPSRTPRPPAPQISNRRPKPPIAAPMLQSWQDVGRELAAKLTGGRRDAGRAAGLAPSSDASSSDDDDDSHRRRSGAAPRPPTRPHPSTSGSVWLARQGFTDVEARSIQQAAVEGGREFTASALAGIGVEQLRDDLDALETRRRNGISGGRPQPPPQRISARTYGRSQGDDVGVASSSSSDDEDKEGEDEPPPRSATRPDQRGHVRPYAPSARVRRSPPPSDGSELIRVCSRGERERAEAARLELEMERQVTQQVRSGGASEFAYTALDPLFATVAVRSCSWKPRECCSRSNSRCGSSDERMFTATSIAARLKRRCSHGSSQACATHKRGPSFKVRCATKRILLKRPWNKPSTLLRCTPVTGAGELQRQGDSGHL